MKRIAITGAGGYIGQALMNYLDGYNGCDAMLGIDLKKPAFHSNRLTFIEKDIRDGSLLNDIKQFSADTMIHLAFVVTPMHDEEEMYSINVNGTLNILDICSRQGIRHIIVASSGTAYGAWPDNPIPLTEEHPIRIFPPSFNYANHKGLNEKHFHAFKQKHPDVLMNIVRPCIVFGPNTNNYLSRYWQSFPFTPLIDGHDPNFQFVHETDVAALFMLLLEKQVDGAFNVAGDGSMRVSDIARMIGKPAFYFPKWMLKSIIWLDWHAHFLFEMPPGTVDYNTYPWVLDTQRAKKLLGWQPQYSTQKTIEIMFQEKGII
ncbi:MAG: NAD-dependent epimerase/dehydratase family protein [Candidatus Magnetomorum sp.]|nr:NAD-dependent epimerase/dehydratase family protein [Candidatus Magnetomorum sp.]